VFGIGPCRVILWPPEGRTDMDRIYEGRPADFTARMAFVEHVAEHGIGVTQRANGIRSGTGWANFDADRLSASPSK
jgi:hypothetical protein